MPTYRVIDSLNEQHVGQLMELYREEWWTHQRTADQVRDLLRWSDLIVGLCDETDSRLVAFARVLTDRVFRAFVFDVIVAKTHRGQGLGVRIMQELLEHPVVRQVELVELYCRPELTPFYEKLGFSRPDSGVVLMRRRAGHNPIGRT